MKSFAALALLAISLVSPWSWADEASTDQIALLKSVLKLEEMTDSAKMGDGSTPCPNAPVEGWDAGVPRLKPGEEIKSKAVLFVTHASNGWDTKSSIKEGVNRNVAVAEERKIPVVYLVHGFDQSTLSGYYLKYRPTYLYESDGGKHEIKARSEVVIFSGGFFEMCSGETARDAFLFNESNPVHAVYLMNSLYTDYGDPKTLKDRFKGKDDKEFIEKLSQVYFPNGEVGTQTYNNDRHATFKDFKFKVFRDGKEIGSFGEGAKVVEMNFLEQQDLSDVAKLADSEKKSQVARKSGRVEKNVYDGL